MKWAPFVQLQMYLLVFVIELASSQGDGGQKIKLKKKPTSKNYQEYYITNWSQYGLPEQTDGDTLKAVLEDVASYLRYEYCPLENTVDCLDPAKMKSAVSTIVRNFLEHMGVKRHLSHQTTNTTENADVKTKSSSAYFRNSREPSYCCCQKTNENKKHNSHSFILDHKVYINGIYKKIPAGYKPKPKVDTKNKKDKFELKINTNNKKKDNLYEFNVNLEWV
nr:uncharacterized protein LOC128677586 [Plodia interpunctella]